MNIGNWGWPQWCAMVLLLLSLIFGFAKHGTVETERINATDYMVRFVIWMMILTSGGFFK